MDMSDKGKEVMEGIEGEQIKSEVVNQGKKQVNRQRVKAGLT